MTYIVLDCPNLAHRAFHGWKSKQGVIPGVLRDLVLLHQVFGSSKFIFCFDQKPYLRSAEYSAYKAFHEDLHGVGSEIEKLKLVLRDIGYTSIFSQEGLEADDLMALLTLHLNTKMVLVSNDNDLYQLLSPKVSIWRPILKQEFTDKLFIKKYSIPPIDWKWVKAIMGCPGDNIQGLEGVGEVKAIQFLRKELPVHFLAHNTITKNWDKVETNLRLVTLPHPDIGISFLFHEIGRDTITRQSWDKTCSGLGFENLIGKAPL